MICPKCNQPITDVIAHYIKCDMNTDRLVAVALLTPEEQEFINRSRQEDAPTSSSPKHNATS